MGSTLGIGKTYLRFFVKNHDERYVLLQGSRRSGKSFAMHKWLWFLGSAKVQTIGIICASFPAMQNCISDFQRATGLTVVGSAVFGYSCNLTNGTKIVFRSFDLSTKAQGTTYDTIFIEEALNIDDDVISVLLMSVSGQVYMAFNPTKNAAIIDKYVNKDKTNILKTTYLDNPYLTDAQRGEFEAIKERAQSPTATTMDKWRYQVYVLGNFADMSGKVFNKIYEIDDDEFSKIDAPSLYSLDFGFVENRDMTALVEVKIHNNCLYGRELIYDNGNMCSDRNLAMRMHELGVTEYEQCVGDFGGFGKTRIHNLVTAGDGEWNEPEICKGFNVANCKKGKIIDGIQTMLNFDRIYVTSGSHHLRREMEDYELDENGKPHGTDHATDAFRYGATSYQIVLY